MNKNEKVPRRRKGKKRIYVVNVDSNRVETEKRTTGKTEELEKVKKKKKGGSGRRYMSKIQTVIMTENIKGSIIEKRKK